MIKTNEEEMNKIIKIMVEFHQKRVDYLPLDEIKNDIDNMSEDELIYNFIQSLLSVYVLCEVIDLIFKDELALLDFLTLLSDNQIKHSTISKIQGEVIFKSLLLDSAINQIKTIDNSSYLSIVKKLAKDVKQVDKEEFQIKLLRLDKYLNL